MHSIAAFAAAMLRVRSNREDGMATLMEWNAGFSVNIREIDRQHEKLFGLLNTLYDAMTQGRGKLIMGRVLAELIDYTEYHFGTEEKLFREHAYPDMDSHIAEHRALTSEAKAFKKRFDAQEVVVTSELLQFLKSWLNHHIIGSDRRYTAFLNAKGVR